MPELPSLYQQQIHVRHYARWSDEVGRRETWNETVDRYIQQAVRQTEKYGSTLTLSERAELRSAIAECRAMPSMRSFMTAGRALERDNVAGYNCAYVACDHPRVFDETLYILCCGTGVGFSVEAKHTTKLPEVSSNLAPANYTIIVGDSKEGWATAFRQLVAALYRGDIPDWDTSRVRKAGERLKTFGGRASGPEPLIGLFQYTVDVFCKAPGRNLTPAEIHGIMCKIGDIVVVGGVRRSAMISLYDPWDDEMVHIKDGAYWDRAPHLRLANNSGVWIDRPDWETFQKQQWTPLREGQSGEPGIVNRAAFQRKAAENGRRDASHEFGCNPCGEIILRSMQFCNLTEVVARPEDGFEDLINKVRLATILGAIQSTFTDFRYIRDEWRENCEEERLLGVSITGVVDNDLLNGRRGMDELRGTLHALKHVAIDTAREWSERLGVNMAAAVTCNKPSGTVAKLVLSGAGINEWHSRFFIQRQRGHRNDPAVQVMMMAGVPWEPDQMDPENTVVFSFPIAAPDNAYTRDEMGALQKLELWLAYSEVWCEHNPSVTINVKDHEWDEVGAFVYEHFDRMAGIAFLPYDNHVYPQAPYEQINEAEFTELAAAMPDEVPWEWLAGLESDDNTEGAKELACVSGACVL